MADFPSIEEKVGQLFFIGIAGPEVDAATTDLLAETRPGGVCLFARNIKTLAQTRDLLDKLCEMLPVPPLLSIDQEGGLVDRLRRVMTPLSAADRVKTADQARRMGSLVGEALSLLGLNMDFAPVVDVATEERQRFQNGLRSRAFGRSKEDVVELAGAFLDGLEGRGILGCLKHFPGLAAAEVDSHEELPQVNISEAEIRNVDLFPYQKLLNRHPNVSVMVAHAAYPNTDLHENDSDGKLLPSSLDRRIVTDLLRAELNFPGVAITDDMEMGAILKNYGIGEACVRAVLAGQDMLAICASPQAVRDGYAAVLEAVKTGRISPLRLETSLKRISDLKQKIAPQVAFDPERLNAISGEIAEFNEQLN